MDEIIEYIKTFPANISKHVTPVKSEEFKNGLTMHMSKDGKIKKFTPMVSTRTASKENRQIPRVSTAPTLVGCMIGYASIQNDFLSYSEEKSNWYKQGYYIYGLDFDYALKPDKTLVPDVEVTDELWLVAYNKETWNIKSKIIGEFFVASLSFTPIDMYLRSNMVIALKVDPGTYVTIHDEMVIGEGYWTIELQDCLYYSHTKFLKVGVCSQIEESEYESMKKVHADMLEYRDALVDW